LAAGGVLFLDEVTEMTPAGQAKFLRVLQEREFRRLGGTRPVRVNVRVIAATNRDLHDAVACGQLRADLYYRLNVFDIRIPPLRERRDDILPLAVSLLRELGGATPELTPGAIQALRRHDWPGNVRELRNVLERAAIVREGRFIDAEHLSLSVREDVPSGSTDLGVLERQAVAQAMREANGNKVRAAKRLGISRMQLYGRLRKFGFEGWMIVRSSKILNESNRKVRKNRKTAGGGTKRVQNVVWERESRSRSRISLSR
jgi:transcriptional regulator with PAS, ATPase and Fis domain